MADGFVLSNQRDAADLLRMLQLFRAKGWLDSGAMPSFQQSKPYTPTPVYIHNDSGEEIPAWACMQVTGTEEIGPQNYLLVDKPADADGTSGWYVFNGSSPIAINEEGMAQSGNAVRGYKNTGTVTAGDAWAPTASQWYLSASADGIFVAAGADDIGTDVLRVLQKGGGGGAAMFLMLEDMPSGHGSKARSRLYDWSQTVTATIDLYNWGNPSTGTGGAFLDGVKAGYWGSAVQDNGRWRFDFGPCVDDFICASSGTLSGNPIAGQQGVAYAFALTASGLNNDIAIDGLPSGLSVNATTGNITGTPAANGVFELIITATANASVGDGTCTLTIVRYLTISPP